MHMHKTWYEPFDNPVDIEKSQRYTLSQGFTTAALPGDPGLWPVILDCADRFVPMKPEEQATAVNEVMQYRPLFSSSKF